MTVFSKRSLEGYVMIDHRESPGLRPEDVAHVPDAIAVGKGQLFESATNACAHCQRLIVVRPERTRPREYCRKCDAYICDDCALICKVTGLHKSYAQVIDEVLEAGIRRG